MPTAQVPTHPLDRRRGGRSRTHALTAGLLVALLAACAPSGSPGDGEVAAPRGRLVVGDETIELDEGPGLA